MTYVCKICGEEKDESKFQHQNGKIRRYICWTCRQKRELAQQKLRLLNAFGCKCACCGETMPAFLTLQHKLGRKEHEGLTNLQIYARAAKEGWPSEKYELLCMNCNFADGHFGVCPHRAGVTPEAALAELRARASVVVEGSVTTGKISDAQKQALDVNRHLGPKARWEGHVKGTPEKDVFSELGITKEQLLEALKKVNNA
jgi:hypothetical protein